MWKSCPFSVLIIVLQLINITEPRPRKFVSRFGSAPGYFNGKKEDRILPGNPIYRSPQNISEPVPRINGPPRCANGGTFCENFDDYPYRHLKDELQKQEVDNEFFGEDQVPIEPNTRIDDEGAFLCSGTERVIFPKVGKNKNNEWRFIVNQGWEDGYVQGVQVETCKRKGPCNIIGELPQGYTSVCQQKYVYRRLLSLKEDGTFAVDSFQLPSSCCCAYKKDFVGFLRPLFL